LLNGADVETPADYTVVDLDFEIDERESSRGAPKAPFDRE